RRNDNTNYVNNVENTLNQNDIDEADNYNDNTNSINIESDYDQSDIDKTNNADSFSDNNNNNVLSSLKNILHSSRKYNNVKNAKHNEQTAGILNEN
ncbi:10611_t:CDS:2, partial [Dentiscutata heterogama]